MKKDITKILAEKLSPRCVSVRPQFFHNSRVNIYRFSKLIFFTRIVKNRFLCLFFRIPMWYRF